MGIPFLPASGIRLPAQVNDLIASKEITEAEGRLLCIIGSMVEWRGKGCWASNQTLATMMGKSKVRIEGMLKRLKEKKLVIVVQTYHAASNRKRILETQWSRSTDPHVADHVGGTLASEGRGTLASEGRGTLASEGNKLNTKKTNKTVAPADAGGDGDGEPMFFESTTKKPSNPSTQPSQQDFADAKLLKDMIVEKKQITTKWSHLSWAKEFRILRAGLPIEADKRITTTLKWYIANMGKEYVPIAHCAKSFRAKFLKIEDQCKREDTKKSIPKEEITPQVNDMLKQLTMLYWSGVPRDQLATAVQQMLNDYIDFRKKALSLHKKLEAKTYPGLNYFNSKAMTLTSLASLLSKQNGTTLLINYFTSVSEKLCWMEQQNGHTFNGHIQKFRLKAGSPEFVKLVTTCVHGHASQKEQERLLEMISNEG